MYTHLPGRFSDPAMVTTHFHIREGEVVADFGAGSGHFMKPLSRAVGKSGTVYLCEIQKTLVEALDIQAREAGLSNVRVVWGDVEVIGGTKLKDVSVDIVILSNVLFQSIDKPTLFLEVSRVLRKGGKLFIIDWSSSFAGLGPQPEHVISEADARRLAEQAGFTYERSIPAGEHHYGLALRK